MLGPARTSAKTAAKTPTKTLARDSETTGHEPVEVPNVSRTAEYRDASLDDWLALTPPALVQGHRDGSDALMQTRRAAHGPAMTG